MKCVKNLTEKPSSLILKLPDPKHQRTSKKEWTKPPQAIEQEKLLLTFVTKICISRIYF